jgi:hypothetical protein
MKERFGQRLRTGNWALERVRRALRGAAGLNGCALLHTIFGAVGLRARENGLEKCVFRWQGGMPARV